MVIRKNSLGLSRRQTLRFIGGIVGGLALHACAPGGPGGTGTSNSSKIDQSKSGGNKSTEKMSVSLGTITWIGLTPLFIALEKGYFKALNLDVDLRVFGSNTDVNAAFLAGQLDATAPVTSEAVLLASKGKDFRIVLVEDNSVGGDGILARNSIGSIKDFKGKRIAVEQGAVSHFFLLQVLKEAGLTEGDVKLLNADAAAAAAAYQAGNVDIAVTYAPFLQQAADAQPDGRIIYDSSKMPTAITDIYIFDSKYAGENPQAVEAFIKGIFQALELLNENPDEGLAIAAKRLEVTPEDLAADLKGVKLPDLKTNLKMLGDPQSDLYLLNSMNDLAKFLLAQKQIDTLPNLEKLVEPKFVKSLDKGN